MPEATMPKEFEPVPELTQSERNGLQVELIQRFVDRGEGAELDWSSHYVAKFAKLVDSDETIRTLIRRDWQRALDVIEEALKDEVGRYYKWISSRYYVEIK